MLQGQPLALQLQADGEGLATPQHLPVIAHLTQQVGCGQDLGKGGGAGGGVGVWLVSRLQCACGI
jgi:hypothetical protein